MLLIVASRYDESAAALARRWRDAALLTPADLSLPGWRFVSGAAGESTVVALGATLSAQSIRGVLTRLPAVTPEELPQILPADREYVASEMTAFLTAWLTELPCRVINRPTPLCLAGPAWRREQWVRAAAAAGMEVVPAARQVSGPTQSAAGTSIDRTVAVPVIARATRLVPCKVADGLRRLAAIAGADSFTAYLTSAGDDARFISADLWLDLYDDSVADAVQKALTSSVTATR